MSHHRGFLPPGDAPPWPDAPFKLPKGELPPRRAQPFGSLERATEIVWRRLDACLDEPLRVEHKPGHTRLWVLDVFYYEVDRDLRQLRGGIVLEDGQLWAAGEILLSRPLQLERSLRQLATRVFRGWPVEEGVAVPYPNGRDKAWGSVMARAWLRLSEDPRFKLVAGSALLHELALDKGAFDLATAACRWLGETRACDYQAAWQNTNAFRKVEAENPLLLPLLPLYLGAHSDRLGPDPVAELKGWFLEQGLSDAAWRYLANCDPSTFSPLWKRVDKPHRLLATLKFLRLMETAGFPQNPQQRVTEVWLDALAHPAETLSLPDDWRAIDPAVVRLAYASARDVAWGIDPICLAETRGVLEWAKARHVRLDKNQAHAGWGRLVARWREECPDARPVLPLESPWAAPTPPIEYGQLRAVPLTSAADLRDESRAMRNCLHQEGYARECLDGRMCIYSIRKKKTGDRVAVAAFRKGPGGWQVDEVKGAGNAVAKPSGRAIAGRVARALGGLSDKLDPGPSPQPRRPG